MSEAQTSHQKELKEEYEIKRQKYANLLVVSASSVGLCLLLNPLGGILLVFTALLSKFSADKVNEVTNSLIQLDRDNAIVRLENLFRERLTNPNTVILCRTRDERLLLSDDLKNSLDFVISLPSSLTLAISIRAMRPIENNPIKVYYEAEKKQLGYRKSRSSGKRKFGIDPVRETKRRVSSLYKNHPELFPSFPETIVLFAEPVSIEIYDSSPVQVFEGSKYLYLKDIYFVDERKLFSLITALEQEKLFKVKPDAEKLQ